MEIKYKKLTGIEMPDVFGKIEINNPCIGTRVYELHKQDVLYCNVEFMKEQKYYQELLLGQIVYLNGVSAKVIKVFKEKKYPNKKWWQFWIKQEEIITGYNLMVI